MSKSKFHLLSPLPFKIGEEVVGGYGDIPSEKMVVIPEAPLTKNGLFPTTAKQMAYLRMLVQAHWKEIYITPLVKYRRDATAKNLYAKDIRYFLPVLYEEISLIQPKRMLVMGKFAAKYLIPNFTNMKNDHGSLFVVGGKDIDPRLAHIESIIMVPTFSFQDTLRDPMAQAYFQRDLERFGYVQVTTPEWEVVENIGDIHIPENQTVTVDVETNGLTLDSHIHMIGIGVNGNIYIAHNPEPDHFAHFFHNVNGANGTMAFHNTTFDLAQMTVNSNYQVPRLKNRVRDTMVMAHISGEHVKNLKHLTSVHTNLPGPHSGGSFQDEQYLAEDIRSTQALLSVPAINKAKGTYAEGLYHDLAPIFVDMRLRGVYMNRDRLVEILVTSEQKLMDATRHLNSFTRGQDINWNSTQQVVEVMQANGVPLEVKTKTGNLSVAEGVLEELIADLTEHQKNTGEPFDDQIAMIKALLEYRALSKLVSGFLRSYLDLLDDLSLLYPNLKLLGTATGRLSCADPNLQQIPRLGDFKLCFEPRWNNPLFPSLTGPGYYGLVDFAGAELRMAAIVSGDRQMAEFILSGDPHSHMAKIAYPNKIPASATIKEIKEDYAYWRKSSKRTTFAMLYGGSVKGIAFKNGVPESEVAAVETALRSAAPDLMGWLDKTKAECVKNLRVATMFGNQRNLLDKWLYEGKGGVERAGINTPIQGSAGILALVVLRKMHNLSVERGLVSRPIFGVHDSVLSEIAEDELEPYARLVQDAYLDIENSPIVESPVYSMLGIQGDLEIGRNWANTESTSEHVDILHSIPCDSREVSKGAI